ncbi:MAG: hypothetical protein AAF755_11305 [Pseudomonadota bacterium]
MSHLIWWLPLSVLTVVASLFVFRSGWIAAFLTESDVIGHYAAQYVQTQGAGASLTDCHAVPGVAPVWIVVICSAGNGNMPVTYHVDRAGKLMRPTEVTAPEMQPSI